MKRFIYLSGVAVWACIDAVSFTPAQATITAPDLRAHVGRSLTLEHCRRDYHCHWTSRGAVRAKHCHVCG